MMINPLATLAEFKSFMTPRGQAATADAVDDVNIEGILEDTSRWVESECHRTFYPRYEKRYFSVPVYQNSPRLLFLDDDLLEEVTITNGDTNVLTNQWYNLRPKNYSPKFGIQLIGPSSRFWIFNGIGSIEWVISVEGWWGFHNKYDQRGWTAVDTLGAAITDTTGVSFTTIAGPKIVANNIFKIDKEIFNCASTGDKSVMVNQRGDNGSTAVTHLNGATIYLWNVQPEIKQTVLNISQSLYQSRSGQVAAGKVSVTAAGVVIRPEDVPSMSQKTIYAFTRIAS